jgi:hypothetical protein
MLQWNFFAFLPAVHLIRLVAMSPGVLYLIDSDSFFRVTPLGDSRMMFSGDCVSPSTLVALNRAGTIFLAGKENH